MRDRPLRPSPVAASFKSGRSRHVNLYPRPSLVFGRVLRGTAVSYAIRSCLLRPRLSRMRAQRARDGPGRSADITPGRTASRCWTPQGSSIRPIGFRSRRCSLRCRPPTARPACPAAGSACAPGCSSNPPTLPEERREYPPSWSWGPEDPMGNGGSHDRIPGQTAKRVWSRGERIPGSEIVQRYVPYRM